MNKWYLQWSNGDDLFENEFMSEEALMEFVNTNGCGNLGFKVVRLMSGKVFELEPCIVVKSYRIKRS